MKFKSIKMVNFMRYKGENQLSFSCDEESNVTVVLGNNTFGKTTIAQAFRWGLYGEVINTKYDKSQSVNLLNNEVLESMDANDRKTVEVTIEVIDNSYIYEFARRAEYVRKYPKLESKQTSERLYMRVNSRGQWSDYITDDGDSRGKDKGKVTDQINQLFPRELSSYFLFDGERWSDEKASKKDIKESINTIMGISALSEMKYHLKEYGSSGSNSVLRLLKNKSAGSDAETAKLEKEQQFNYAQITECKKKIEVEETAEKSYIEFVKKSEEILNGNQKIEEEQKEAVRLEKAIKYADDRIEKNNVDFLKYYSREAFKILLTPLYEKAEQTLAAVDLDGKGIPNVNDQTIYYLLEHGECLCGAKLTDGSEAIKHLQKLLDIVPPKVIGSEVGYFQEKLQDWAREAEESKTRLEELANSVELDKADRDDLDDELFHINKRIDGKINFGQERIRLEGYKRKLEECRETIRKSEKNIIEYERRISTIDEELEELAKKNEKTLRFRRILAYAEALENLTEKKLKEKEGPLFDELNERIKTNFAEMFSERDKYAQLGEDYKLHLYYKSITSEGEIRTLEETVLSEGEKIACNFVFIVSILELAQEKKATEDDDLVVSLPLVLDAPFSKLSGENTELIASALPKTADQVIIFMLDKDWEASGLEKYTSNTYKYRVSKEADAASSSILKEV